MYLGISSGVVVNLHYCMGDLSSVNYGFEKDEACGKCGMKEKKGCCTTEYKLVKLQDEHQLAKTSIEFVQLDVAIPENELILSSFVDKLSHLSLAYHSPPDRQFNSIYLHNCVFRI